MVNIQQIHSNDNLAYLFANSLPTSSFEKLVYKIEIRWFWDIKWCSLETTETKERKNKNDLTSSSDINNGKNKNYFVNNIFNHV